MDFLSAICLPGGRVICRPEATDSHDELRSMTSHTGLVARLELIPPELGTSWTERVIGDVPDWFDARAKALAFAAMRQRIKDMTLTDDRDMLVGGCWILAGTAKIQHAVNCRIAMMADESQILSLEKYARVGRMRDASRIFLIRDSAVVEEMEDDSQVHLMHHAACVHTMRNRSNIVRMWHRTHVRTMLDVSTVHLMTEGPTVATMLDSARVLKQFGREQ